MDQLTSLFSQSRHQEVIALYINSDIPPGADPNAAQIVAASYFKLGKYQYSYNLLSEIYSVFADDLPFLSLFAATCRKLSKLDESKSIFSRALAINPEDITLNNNYSNLLIDLGQLEEAINILTNIVKTNPDYADAQTNLRRAEQLHEFTQKQSHPSSATQKQSNLLSDHLSLPDYVDPLLFAFTEEEVTRTAPFRPVGLNTGDAKSTKALQSAMKSPDLHLLAADQLSLAQKAILEKNPSFALKLCTKAHMHIQHRAELYSTLGDAYIALKRFSHAESCYLLSISFGSSNFKNYFNLASLYLMKKDFPCAEHYLSLASSIDPSNTQLDRIKQSILTSVRDKTKAYALDFSNVDLYPI